MNTLINRSAIKRYALKVSEQRRAGTFTRVSEEWLIAIETEVETAIRRVVVSSAHDAVPSDPGADWFITGEATKRIEQRLNDAIKTVILNKVMSHPTVGCTLKP